RDATVTGVQTCALPILERHRHDPQVLRELAHAERLDPANVGKRHGGAQHAAPAQGGPARSLDLLSQILFPLDKCTTYTYTAHWEIGRASCRERGKSAVV